MTVYDAHHLEQAQLRNEVEHRRKLRQHLFDRITRSNQITARGGRRTGRPSSLSGSNEPASRDFIKAS
ncbi:hypothetical protein EXU48_03865 [Occultella glacieicola]|uniref:Transposase n=1 Tax=Occultella glacieicola TaxID=2518684 RepID=A0ABY2E7Q2_9MICO|nr:hypothetical protein [Occultella glacieicola]TDE97345.1 hypothetical protein EXU48_03865 [Occultella glacieicola]